MQVGPHPQFSALHSAMRRLRAAARPLSVVIYRFEAPMYAGASEVVSGRGSQLYGARWNAPGSFAAVYGSLQPETPLKETQGHAARFGIPFSARLPRTLVAVRVTLFEVLDLNDGALRRRLRVSRRRMVDEDWWSRQQACEEALTQAIGRAAYAAGFEALLVPCAVDPRAVNSVVFPDNLGPRSSLRVPP
jgi:RES domain-containing protein